MKKYILSFSIIFTLCLLVGCAQSAKTTSTASANPYTNPVFDADFPDPTILRTTTGWYYGYATQSLVDNRWQNIQVIRSRDLVNWERVGDGLPAKPAWASKTQNFWAPDVSEHDGEYYMYFAAEKDGGGGMCLGAALADQPGGPFKPAAEPLACGTSFVNIDPMSFDDPKTGKRLLYWGSGFQPIKVRELAPDRMSFLPGSKGIDLVFPDSARRYQNLVEGAWVVEHDGYYYLFFSGDNCCGSPANNYTPYYAVMVARSQSATGPFETLAKATGKESSVILEKNDQWDGPGHNSVIRDAAGQDWIFYHAISPANRVFSGADPNQKYVRRVMLMDSIIYKDGWPTIANGTPSTGQQNGPAVAKP
jgi:arabinan endo-1,5-alpha-L-arabinosidase